jgi:uncharacterized repeat protein (TIGR02543 family)
LYKYFQEVFMKTKLQSWINTAGMVLFMLLIFSFFSCPSEVEEPGWNFETGEGVVILQFLSNGGDTAADPQRVVFPKSGGRVEEEPVVPVKAHNTFEGWYTDKDDGEPVSFPITVTTNTNFYAHWTPNTYTVTFHGNNGTPVSQELSVTYPNLILDAGALNEPTQPGYAFAGWFLSDQAGADSFSLGDEINASTDVYAQWGEILTVIFDGNGGTWEGGEDTRQVEVIKPLGTTDVTIGVTNMPSAPQKAPSIFAGWYDTANSTGGMEFTGATAVSANTTVYARWSDLTDGLVLYYDFIKQGNTQIRDNSGGGHLATFMAGTSTVNANNSSTNPRYGSATKNGKTIQYYHQSASSSAKPHMSMDSAVGSDIIANLDDAFTISVIVTPYSGTARTAAAFMNGADLETAVSGGLYLSSTSSDIGYYITATNKAAAQKLTTTVTDTGGTVAYHLCYTQEGRTGSNNGKLYVNGVLAAQGDITLLPADIGATTNNYLARPFNDGSDYLGWPAKLAEFRIYNRALSADEIIALAADKDVLN